MATTYQVAEGDDYLKIAKLLAGTTSAAAIIAQANPTVATPKEGMVIAIPKEVVPKEPVVTTPKEPAPKEPVVVIPKEPVVTIPKEPVVTPPKEGVPAPVITTPSTAQNLFANLLSLPGIRQIAGALVPRERERVTATGATTFSPFAPTPKMPYPFPETKKKVEVSSVADLVNQGIPENVAKAIVAKQKEPRVAQTPGQEFERIPVDKLGIMPTIPKDYRTMTTEQLVNMGIPEMVARQLTGAQPQLKADANLRSINFMEQFTAAINGLSTFPSRLSMPDFLNILDLYTDAMALLGLEFDAAAFRQLLETFYTFDATTGQWIYTGPPRAMAEPKGTGLPGVRAGGEGGGGAGGRGGVGGGGATTTTGYGAYGAGSLMFRIGEVTA